MAYLCKVLPGKFDPFPPAHLKYAARGRFFAFARGAKSLPQCTARGGRRLGRQLRAGGGGSIYRHDKERGWDGSTGPSRMTCSETIGLVRAIDAGEPL